ncbi:MAG: hypothetical protein SNJ76_04165 [Fimbriimonadaceae bacterium]
MILAVAIVAALTAGAVAQPGQGRGGFGGRGGMMMGGGLQNDTMLLMRSDVQAELKLTADQRTRLEQMQERMRQQMMERMQSGGMMGDREAMQAEFRRMQEETTRQVNSILTADQQKRLKEISIQMAGARAVMREDVAKELGITADQKTRLDRLQEAQRAANQSIMEKMRNGELDREQGQASMERNRVTLDAEIMKILTEAQRAKLKEMGGAPFQADPNASVSGGQQGQRPGGARRGPGR